MWQVLGGLIPHIKSVLEVLIGNKTAKQAQDHAADVATAEAYGKEWSYAANGRNWWDSLWDGVNRMPRPLMGLGVPASFVWMFYLAMEDTERFERAMVALGRVPEPLWILLGTVATFFFGARTLELSRAPASVADAGMARGSNPVVDAWKKDAMTGD